MCSGNGLIYYFIVGVTGLDVITTLHRVVNPLISYPVLFLFIWSLIKSLKSQEKKYCLFCGFCFGSLFLSYIYFAIFAFFFLTIRIGIDFTQYQKEIGVRKYFKNLLDKSYFFVFASLPGIIVFFKNYFSLSEINEIFMDWRQRAGIINTRSLILENSEYIHFLLVIPAILIFLKTFSINKSKKYSYALMVSFSLYISAWIASHSNVITGTAIQKTNFTAYLNFPFFLILTFISLFSFFEAYGLQKRFFNFFFVFISFFLTIFNVNYASEYSHKLSNNFDRRGLNLSLPKEERKLLRWLDSDQFVGNKILADISLSMRIGAFTKKDTYYVDYVSKVTNSDLTFRRLMIYFVLSESFKKDANDSVNNLSKYKEELHEGLINQYLEEFFISKNPNINFYTTNNSTVKFTQSEIFNELKKNNVTHVIKRGKTKNLLNLKLEKEFNDIKVYKLI